MELVANARPALVFVWPQTAKSRSWSTFPNWNGSAIVVANDLKMSGPSGEVPLPTTLSELLQRCPRILLVGAVRKQALPEDHKMLDVIELTPIDRDELRDFAHQIASAESANIGKRVDFEDVMDRYNGYPASLVAGVNAMRDIYRQLEPGPCTTLQAARLLWEIGLRTLTTDRIWEVAELLQGAQFSVSQRTHILAKLERQGFITLRENHQAWFEIYEAYLEQVLELPREHSMLEAAVFTLWSEHADGDAFVERGNTFNDPASLKFQLNPQQALDKAVAAYQEALRFYSPERAP